MTSGDLFNQARQGIHTHRLRATLSSIGIIVGVGTVVASLSIAEGARRSALEDIGALGIDNVFARSLNGASLAGATDRAAPELTRSDAVAIQSTIAGIEVVAVIRSTRAAVAADVLTALAPVAGVSAAWARLANTQCERGRWLTDEDDRRGRRVAVLGSKLAKRLAPGTDVLGRSIAVAGQIFHVVGILESAARRKDAASLQAFNPDDSVLVPSTVMDAPLGNGDGIDRVSEIGVHVREGTDVTQVGAAMSALLARRHAGASHRYELVVPRELLQAKLKAQRTFDAVLLATGFIALVISGIGIMNVMLASVAERRQEIGVRRALGARQGEIVVQFAVEAALLCLAGGVLGVPLGGLLAWVVSLMAGWPVALSLADIALALCLAGCVGLGFGTYPAYRGAAVDPIDALRA